jgi:O-antigen ligase
MRAWSSQRDSLSPRLRRLATAGCRDLLLVPFLGLLLLVRVLTDDRSAPDSRHSGSVNLSAVIAMLFVFLAFGLLLRQRHNVLPTVLVLLWLCVWTAIAVHTEGASTETLREGVREVSVLALAVIVCNAHELLSVPIVTRLVQLVGLIPAVLALYQLATHTGLDVAHVLRANGTFAHPNSAAMFFAIAAAASLWRYLDNGRQRSDGLLVALFAGALIATFSIDGLITLVVMLSTFGALHPGGIRVKLVPCAIAGVVAFVFFATPLGAQRIAGESATSLEAAERGETTSSLDTRLYRWKTLLPEWERSPVFGQGLGVTTTAENTSTNRLNSLLPHNEYIRYLVETGIVGLAIIVAAVTFLVRRLIRRWRTPSAFDADALNAPLLALVIIVGCLVNSLADNTLLNSPTCYAAALILAAVLASPGVAISRAPIPRTA